MNKKIIRSIITIFCITLGISLAKMVINSPIMEMFKSDSMKWLSICIYVAFGLILGIGGFFAAPKLMKAYFYIAKAIERRFSDIPLAEVFVGVIGLIIGLVIAYLISSLTFKIEPKLLGIVISIMIFLICGYVGWVVPTKRIKEINMPKWFKRSDRGVGRSIAIPKVLDTSAIIDGRFFDVYNTGIVEGTIIIPQFVLDELHKISDSADPFKRARGRHGLDMLKEFKDSQVIAIYDNDYKEFNEVDVKLLKFASEHHAMIVTNDYNLNKIALLQGIPVFNINDLANALKISVTSGEELVVTVVKEGKEATQGIAYLNDGTMVVIDGAKSKVGQMVTIIVSSVLQTSAGKMVFAKLKNE